MLASEIAELLALASAYDNRRVTPEQALAWKAAVDSEVPSLTVQPARQIIVNHFVTCDDYFTVKHLVDGAKDHLRLLPRQVAADVRSAKARGLISKEWDERAPIPSEVAQRLYAARTEAQVAAPDLYATNDRRTLQVDVGRKVPRT